MSSRSPETSTGVGFEPTIFGFWYPSLYQLSHPVIAFLQFLVGWFLPQRWWSWAAAQNVNIVSFSKQCACFNREHRFSEDKLSAGHIHCKFLEKFGFLLQNKYFCTFTKMFGMNGLFLMFPENPYKMSPGRNPDRLFCWPAHGSGWWEKLGFEIFQVPWEPSIK